MLISLNKRNVRENRSKEFAFRHDWNSLLDVRPEEDMTPPVTSRTKMMFPHADTAVHYFQDFAEEQRPHIRYGTTVKFIQRPGGPGSNFRIKLARNTSNGHVVMLEETCQEIIIATGIFRPHGAATRVDGERHTTGYEDMPEKGDAFEGKSVMVLGMGNAAMETVEELHKYTSEMHLFARRRELPDGTMGIRFAYQTHYVGDIRAGRFGILDTYLLKSLDTFDFNALDDKIRMLLIPCMEKRLCVFEVQQDDCADKHCRDHFNKGGQDLHYKIPMGQWIKDGNYPGDRLLAILRKYAKTAESLAEVRHQRGEPAAEHFTYEISETNPATDDDQFEDDKDEEKESESALERNVRRKKLGIVDKVFNDTQELLSISSRLLQRHPQLMNAMVPLMAHGGGGNTRYPMDAVIRCFGWSMDTDIFCPKTVPVKTTHNGKYPTIKHTYESDTVPGLHFAGTLGHSLDFRRSAGGFVHGFRYTARAIFRFLEEKNHNNPWPHKTIPLTVDSAGGVAGLDELVQTFMRRINEASGPYQMFETLGDVAFFEVDPESETKQWRVRYLEDVPIKHFDKQYKHLPRLFWVFEYNQNFTGPKVLGEDRVGSTSPYTAEHSNFLHPHLFYSAPHSMKPALRHWLKEDIFTQWDNTEDYAPLARFVAHAAAAATGIPRLEQEGAVRLQQPIDSTGFASLEQALAALEDDSLLDAGHLQDSSQSTETADMLNAVKDHVLEAKHTSNHRQHEHHADDLLEQLGDKSSFIRMARGPGNHVSAHLMRRTEQV